ncbi:MAG: hypothetical protein ACP5HQ_04600 [Thermoprotei archaeon]
MQRPKSCPYYRSGFCTSPILDTPSDYVTDPSRCLGNFATCRYYPGGEKGTSGNGGLANFMDSEEADREISYYSAINVLDSPIDSGCKHFHVLRTSKGLVAKCDVQNRILTKSQALLCVKYYNSCPFAIISS